MKTTTTPAAARAFTLPEMLVGMAAMIIVVGGVIGANLYGLKMRTVTEPKLGASDEARRAVSLMTSEIRSAFLIKVGTGSLSSFSEVGMTSPQVGSAIQIYPSTNTSSFIRYFWDSVDRKLKRTTNGMTSTFIVANSVSNQMVFRSEDFAGNTLSNNFNNRVISLTLSFYQIQYPITPIGPGNYYDFYQLRARITRRTLL